MLDIVGITIGINDSDNRHIEAVGFAHGDILAVDIDDEHDVRHFVH